MRSQTGNHELDLVRSRRTDVGRILRHAVVRRLKLGWAQGAGYAAMRS